MAKADPVTVLKAPTRVAEVLGHPKPEPLVHFQREWYGVGRGLCGSAVDSSNIPVDLVVANPGAAMGKRLCAGCVSRFHRIGAGDVVKAERLV